MSYIDSAPISELYSGLARLLSNNRADGVEGKCGECGEPTPYRISRCADCRERKRAQKRELTGRHDLCSCGAIKKRISAICQGCRLAKSVRPGNCADCSTQLTNYRAKRCKPCASKAMHEARRAAA